MKNYITKPRRVRAVQYTQSSAKSIRDLVSEAETVWEMPEGNVILQKIGVMVPGDWLVIDQNGTAKIYSDSKFQHLYQELSG